jgi:hypothetical protein
MTNCPALEFKARVAELEAEEDRIGYWTDEAEVLRDRQWAFWMAAARAEPVTLAGAEVCALAIADQLRDGALADGLRAAGRALGTDFRRAAWRLLSLLRSLPAAVKADGLGRFLRQSLIASQRRLASADGDHPY